MLSLVQLFLYFYDVFYDDTQISHRKNVHGATLTRVQFAL